MRDTTIPRMRPNTPRVIDEIKAKLDLFKFSFAQLKLRINAQYKTSDNSQKSKNKNVLDSLSSLDDSHLTYTRTTLFAPQKSGKTASEHQKQLDFVNLTALDHLNFNLRVDRNRRLHKIKHDVFEKQALEARRTK